ncbi:MAG: DUF962 domain-containing protein, partial [Myxococcales bacterium]|nr:DUF962 domain-containing protein [Myxococcales bacterium]
LFGIPILVVSGIVGIAALSWRIVVAGQVIGWAIQILGHRIEGNRPALLRRKMSFVMGPVMVGVELLERLGLRFAFAERARRILGV